MVFTYDPDQESYTNLNLLRLLIGDTDSDYDLFTDNELNGLLTLFSNDLYKAASWALRALSVDPDRLMKMKDATSGGVSLMDLMDRYVERATAILG